MLNRNKLVFILAGILFVISGISAQNNAQISADELIYNFGTIGESDGLASHIFKIKNTGNGPLVITRITASCGCTQPEWTKEPIAPGKIGEVKVTYNPKGRPGPFYKTIAIYSNGKKGSFSLGIKGNVTPKEAQPILIYPYSIGDLKLQTKNILYSTVRPEETLGEKISIINEGKTSLNVHLGKTPHYLNIVANPAKLAPGETGEISILINAKEAKRKGRVTAEIPLTVESVGQKKGTESHLYVAANIIDDFSKLTTSEKAKAPVAQLSGTLLDFGKLPDKSSFIPLVGGRVSGTIEITNSGKSPLVIYSASCDDERVAVSGGKKEIKPGMSTWDINHMADTIIRDFGCVPNFLNYNGYPATICTSVNDEVVHGIPSKKRILQDGDIISLDCGLIYKGYHSDAARTWGVGEISKEAQRLIDVTKQSFFEGIKFAKEGNHLYEISKAIQDYAEGFGYSIVRDLVGHGIGTHLHEDPQIPNFKPKGRGLKLQAGMTLAIEPMINEGVYDVEWLDDDWTVVTADGKLSAHYENTILVTKDGCEILTLR
mgnify:CR=1 FL=1